MLNIDQVQTEGENFDNKICSVSTAKESINITDRATRWGIILFNEGLDIKEENPSLNNGLKASKELKLFYVITIWLIQLTFVCLLTFIVTYCKVWSLCSYNEIVSISKYKLFWYFKASSFIWISFVKKSFIRTIFNFWSYLYPWDVVGKIAVHTYFR